MSETTATKPADTTAKPEDHPVEALALALWRRFRTEDEHAATLDDEDEHLDRGTGLAVERTSLALNRSYLACERTLMAWIRTSLSMISFGFTIGKVVSAMAVDERVSKSILGKSFSIDGIAYFLVIVGTGILCVAAYQHRQQVKDLVAMGMPRKKVSLAFVVSLLLAALGLFAFSSLAMHM